MTGKDRPGDAAADRALADALVSDMEADVEALKELLEALGKVANGTDPERLKKLKEVVERVEPKLGAKKDPSSDK
jgi:hypothetical protein